MPPQCEAIRDASQRAHVQTENMKLRSSLLFALREQITEERLTQRQAANKLGVTQPRISHLMRGRVDLFGIDTLVKMLARVGFRVELRIVRPPKPLDFSGDGHAS